MLQAADCANKHLGKKDPSNPAGTHVCLTYLPDSQETFCKVPDRSWNQEHERSSSCHREGDTFCPWNQARPLWRDRCPYTKIIRDSGYGLIWSHRWSVWILLSKVRTPKPMIMKQHNHHALEPPPIPLQASSKCAWGQSSQSADMVWHSHSFIGRVLPGLFVALFSKHRVGGLQPEEFLVFSQAQEGRATRWHPVNKIPDAECMCCIVIRLLTSFITFLKYRSFLCFVLDK